MTAKFGVLINANVKGENNIKRLGNSMQGVQGKVKNLGNSVKGLSFAFKGLFAAAAIGGMTAFVKSSIDAADAFGKLEVRTGIAANQLQAYVNAGKLADVSQKQLTTGLKTFARTQIEAADGVATYADAYNKLGVQVKATDGSIKASDKLLGEIADKFATLPDGPEKAALAMDIFGKSGADMITLLNGGSEALDKFNFKVSEDFAQNSEYFNDQITTLQIGFEGFRMQLTDALLPALNSIMEAFGDILGSEADFGPLFKVIEVGIRGIASVVLGLVQSMQFFTRTLSDLVKIAQLVGQGQFGQAFDVAKVGLADTQTQFFEDIAAQEKVLFGRSAAPEGYGRRTGRREFEIGDVVGGDSRKKAVKKSTKEIKELKSEYENFSYILNDFYNVWGQQAEGITVVNEAYTKQKEKLEEIADVVSGAFADSVRGLVDGTKTMQQAFADMFQNIANSFMDMAMGILQNAITQQLVSLFGSLLGPSTFASNPLSFGGTSLGVANSSPFDLTKSFGFAKGGVFAQNKIVPFAYGGIVNKPTMFPMANGAGLMGEAGPEAIMPLRRGAGGRLGVEAQGAGVGSVVVNVDASGTKAEGDDQGAKQLGSAIGAAVQAELIKQQRPGGLLAR